MKILENLFFFVVRVYQASGSLLRARCRFWPSCSEYAREAVALHGLPRGLGLGVRRFLRCHPFGKSGFDPVPADVRP